MKKNWWLIFGMLISAGVLADQPMLPPSAAPIETPGPAPVVQPEPVREPAPAPATSAQTTRAAELKTVPLVAGPAVVDVRNRVNVRGQARLNSEVLTQMTNGEPVTVIEEVTLKRSKADEPSVWAKIALPQRVHPWVHSRYIEPATKAVTATKLNVRGGPGENYSVVGTLQRGDTVTATGSKGDWIQIEPPADAYAFMAAQYLRQPEPEEAAPALPAEPLPTEPTLAAAPVNEGPSVAAPSEPEVPVVQLQPSAGDDMPPEEPEVEEPLPPRIVQREGIVRSTFSIQAPTPFELVSPENHRPVNYLYTSSTNLDLSRYKGLHIVVTGEEGLDERWRNTPVITIQRIQVID